MITLPTKAQSTEHLIQFEDSIPGDIGAFEYQGRIYVRKSTSPELQARHQKNIDLYRAGSITLQTFLQERSQASMYQFIDPISRLSITPKDGMIIRLISQELYESVEAGGIAVLHDQISAQIRKENLAAFRIKYARDLQEVSKIYPNHSKEDTELLLRIIARINPDFTIHTDGGLARINTEHYEEIQKSIRDFEPTSLRHQIEIIWRLYHEKIVGDVLFGSISKEAQKIHDQARYTDKSLDIERQVRGLSFILKFFVSRPSDPSKEDE